MVEAREQLQLKGDFPKKRDDGRDELQQFVNDLFEKERKK